MTTLEVITALFCRIDDAVANQRQPASPFVAERNRYLGVAARFHILVQRQGWNADEQSLVALSIAEYGL